tara:strand:+ start:7147 stop:8889 length:1743 start_codon:yes stop_codon:yes gene_type:complete
MKKFSDREYQIYENLAQAKSILRKNGGSIEDDKFLQIADATNKDGWTGLLTRLVYRDNADVEEVIGFYPDLKKSKLDLGKLNKMSYDDIVDTLYDDANSDNDGIEFVARYGSYLIFHVKTFEDGLKICSPAWCLKTRIHWDDYTNGGYQFVVIDEEYTNKSGKTNLQTPNSSSYMGSYSNTKKPGVRYGISVKSDYNIKVFDDSNREDPNYPSGILHEIKSYIKNKGGFIIPSRGEDTSEFDYIKEKIIYFVENISIISGRAQHWDYSVYAWSDVNYYFMFNTFIEFMEEDGIDIYEFYHDHRQEIINDHDLTFCCGTIDWILYRLSGNADHDDGGIPLSGMFLKEREFGANSFKYIYGFAQNKYGKMYVLQSYPTIADWYEFMLMDFYKVFLTEDESYTAYTAYTPPMEYLNGWLNDFDSIIQEFFHSSVEKTEHFVSVDFYIDQFIETMQNWIKLKVKMAIDETYNDRIISPDGGVDNQLLVDDLWESSKYTSNNRIVNFIMTLDDEMKFLEYAGTDSVNELNRESVIKFFNNVFLIDGEGHCSTSMGFSPNKNSKETSDEVLTIRLWYKAINKKEVN